MKDIRISFIEGSTVSSEVLEFVRRAYRKAYGTSPGVAKTYVVAWRHGKVIGCMGIEEANEAGGFPIERIYKLDRGNSPLPYDESNTLQFGRLVTSERQLTPLVLYSSSWYGVRNGKLYGLVEHNAAVHRALERFGIRFEKIECGKADIELVSEGDRAYYAKQEMRPYIADLRAAMEALESHIPAEAMKLFFS